jgi:hypothetical protein
VSPSHLEITRFLELGHVTLSLERTTRGEENILVVSIHVLCPCRKPGDRFVMDDGFPGSRDVWLWDGDALANVNSDILRVDTKLSAALVKFLYDD